MEKMMDHKFVVDTFVRRIFQSTDGANLCPKAWLYLLSI